MKNIYNIIIYAILILIIGLLGWLVVYQNKMIDKQTIQLSTKNEDDNKHVSIVYEQQLETLKKINEDLYDSLKIYKDEIDYLVQLNFQKEYVVHDTIYKTDTLYKKENINEYTYYNKDKNDTLEYQLKIGSEIEPNWYSIKFKINEQFTIVNKQIDNINETTIAPSSNGNITNVTVLKNKKSKFMDNITFGPSITAGYCLGNRNLDVMLGISATIKLNK